MAPVSMQDLVRAAGGVVWRLTERSELEVLLVHRPKYDDWSFPKGKLDPGVNLLPKPFRRDDLARKIRAVLDSDPRHDRSSAA